MKPLFLLSLLLWQDAVYADACAGWSNPNLPGGGITNQTFLKESKFRFGVQFGLSYSEAGHTVDSTQFEPGVPISDQASEHHPHFYLGNMNLSGSYGITDLLSIGIEFPVKYVQTEVTFRGSDGIELNDFESIHHRDEVLFDPGDPSLLLKISLDRFLPDNVSLKFQGGITLPLGEIEEDPFELGSRGLVHQHIQFGTGTVNPTAGYVLNYKIVGLNILKWMDFSTSLYKNKKGFRGGSKTHTGIGILHPLATKNWGFLFQPEFYYESPDKWGSQQARNSGRTDIILTGGSTYQWNSAWTINLSLKAPVYRKTNGGQLETPLIMTFGLATDL